MPVTVYFSPEKENPGWMQVRFPRPFPAKCWQRASTNKLRAISPQPRRSCPITGAVGGREAPPVPFLLPSPQLSLWSTIPAVIRLWKALGRLSLSVTEGRKSGCRWEMRWALLTLCVLCVCVSVNICVFLNYERMFSFHCLYVSVRVS